MNLILLHPTDFIAELRVHLSDYRFEHMMRVHKAKPGEQFQVGLINDKLGTGRVERIDEQGVELTLELNREPPAPLPVTLIVALPRPQMIKRTLQTIATMGVKRLIFVQTNRVEKSYWQSPVLSAESIHEHLTLGLEQGCDTLMPEVIFKQRFRPFIEDELPELIAGKKAMIAHPGLGQSCPREITEPSVLAIGPEGGFVDYEVEQLINAGFEGIDLGPRILRVETAIPVLLAKLF